MIRPDSAVSALDIPFNRVWRSGAEAAAVTDVLESEGAGGDGPRERCERMLERLTGTTRTLLTHSCTGALEVAALLAQVGPGDEVIMPSYTYVSTANAFVLRGATPVFVDIDPDTLCLDPARAADAITPATKVIVPVHYAGVGCDMEAILALARDAGALVVEDAAHGIGAAWRDKALGTIGDLGVISFHETKNVTCGQGGALLLNDPEWVERAEVHMEKGTSRSKFSRGEIDRYTWVDLGSSYLMADLVAAVLSVQLEHLATITAARIAIWERYHAGFADLESRGTAQRLRIPAEATHNAHLYPLVFEDPATAHRVSAALAAAGISARSHYAPLHDSPAGRRFGRTSGSLPVTERAGSGLVRLPLWVGLQDGDVDRVIDEVHAATT